MKLNHIDLQVPDVPTTAAYFERHFGFEILGNRSSAAIIILRGEGGFTLVLQRAAPGEAYPEGFHIGFLVDDVAAVRAAHARLAAAGAAPRDVSSNNRGTMFYLHAPGAIVVEVSCRRATTAHAAT